MSLPHYNEFDWEPHLLTISPDYDGGLLDKDLTLTIPLDSKIFSVKAIPISLTKYFGVYSLYWRCLPYLLKRGSEVIKQNKYDLIFFSTTVFTSMILGLYWKKKFGIPYIVDIQDPWVNDYKYINPPGGRIKYKISQIIAGIFEKKILKNAEHIISVSNHYPELFNERYSEINKDKFTVLPFGVSKNDFEILKKNNISQIVFDPNDGNDHWVYVGRGGEDFIDILKPFFLSIREDREDRPIAWEKIKIHFIGTSYAEKGRESKIIKPVADEFGISDIVREYPRRVSYLESLKLLTDSKIIILLGSKDITYSPSKIYPCVFANKPILSIFHEESYVTKLLNDFDIKNQITFNSNNSNNELNELKETIKNKLHYFTDIDNNFSHQINWKEFNYYSAENLTHIQCNIFNSCLN